MKNNGSITFRVGNPVLSTRYEVEHMPLPKKKLTLKVNNDVEVELQEKKSVL